MSETTQCREASDLDPPTAHQRVTRAPDPSDAVVPDAPAAAAPATLTPANRRLLALLLCSAFVVILNETTMSVALPPIMDDFGISAAAGQWLTTAFLLTMAVVIPTTGWLLGRLGTRVSFVVAMGAFSVGTALAAFAPTFEILLTARVVQASGTAVMMPLLMTTVMAVVPARARGRVMGNVALVIAAAPALGPTASGLVLRSLSWHWIFGLVLPIALVALACGARWVRAETEAETGPLDVLSVPLAVVAFGGLVVGLSLLGEASDGGSSTTPWVAVVLGVAALTVFVWRQLRLAPVGRALLDVRVLGIRDFTVALGIMCLAMFAMFGVMMLLPLLTQRVLGLEPLGAGLVMLPGALAMGLLGPVVGRMYDAVGARPLALPGLVLAAGALALLAAGPRAVGVVLAGHVLMSLGMALVFTPMFTVALSAVAGPLVAHGSATIGTLQQLAGAAGTAALVAVMTTGQASRLAAGASESDALAGGIQSALWVGVGALVVAALLAVSLRRPADVPGGGAGNGAGDAAGDGAGERAHAVGH